MPEPTVTASLLSALDLAHRWHVPHVVQMVERELVEKAWHRFTTSFRA